MPDSYILCITCKSVDEQGGGERQVAGQDGEGAVQPGGGVVEAVHGLAWVVGRHLDHPWDVLRAGLGPVTEVTARTRHCNRN
jgi:hypothetical protein